MDTLENNTNKSCLLLGNGLNRAYSSESWDDLLKKIYSSLHNDQEMSPTELDLLKKIPMNFQIEYITISSNAKNRANRALQKVYKDKIISIQTDLCDSNVGLPGDLLNFYSEILQLGIEDILTTNYTYELEYAYYNQSKSKKKFINYLKEATNFIPLSLINPTNQENKISGDKSYERKYILRTYHQCTNSRIWHIHGEILKPETMLMDFDYYLRFNKYIDETTNLVKNLEKETSQGDFNCCNFSWLQSFLSKDIYILGLGLDYSELDLWKLIKNKNNGNVYYIYKDLDTNEQIKIRLLNSYKVKTVRILSNNWKKFYKDSLKFIKYNLEFDRLGEILNSCVSFKDSRDIVVDSQNLSFF